MSRRAWFVGLALLAVPACSRPPTPEEAAARVVGTWKHVRENGELVQPRTGVSGLLQFGADGAITYEQVTEVETAGKTPTRQVKPTTGTYRFLDAETLEITGDDRGQVKTWAVRAVLAGKSLTLHKPHGQVDEFERLK